MHAGARAGGVIHPARSVVGGAGSRTTAAPQRPPHMFPQRRIGPCIRRCSAQSSPVATARRAIAACNVARYSES